MAGSQLDQERGQRPERAEPNRPILVVSAVLFVLAVVLTGYGAFLLVNGSPEGYHNENLRHLAVGISQMALTLALITGQLRRNKTTYLLLAICLGVQAWWFSLALLGR